MSIQFSLVTGKTLSFLQGLTTHYNSVGLKGLPVSHIKSSFGEIVLQEYIDEYVSFRSYTINWQRPERLVCKYNNPPGVHTRIALNKSIHEYLKGAGDIYLKKEGFSIVIGGTWTGLLSALGPGEHNFVDIGWSRGILPKVFNTEDPIKQSTEEIVDGLPEKIITAPNYLNGNMRTLLGDVISTDFSHENSKYVLQNRLIKYFRMMMDESVHFEARKRKMKETEWYTVHVAKQMIENNPERQFTTTEISRMIGINEFSLKQLFPKIIGYSLDEYRKYKLFGRLGKSILRRTDSPLKSFYNEAGYTNYSNFSKGFQKQCSCTPSELRDDSWDLDGLPNYKAEDDDQ